MSTLTPDEAAGRRVDAKVARSNERLDRRYSAGSDTSQREAEVRARYLRSLAIGSRGGRAASQPR